MKFSYKARTPAGQPSVGLIEAKNLHEAGTYLRGQGMYPIKITQADKPGLAKYLPFLNKSSGKDIVFFTRQLSSMLAAGLTLMQALVILRDQMRNPSMQEMVRAVISDVEVGKTFSQALEKHPKMFGFVYISLIRAAEGSGVLDKVLLRLADNLEKEQKLKSTIKSALTYPTIVVIGMVLVTTVMMIFVIPQVSLLYKNLNVELPLPTLVVVTVSDFVRNFWFVVVGGVVLVVYLIKRWRKTEAGRLLSDDYILKVPIFGKLIEKSILAEFSRTLGLLIGTGALVVQALNQTSDVAGNIIYQNAIQGVARRVEKGLSVADALGAYSVFPVLLIQMVKIGEETGKLDETLIKASEYFEREVDDTVKTLTTAMEPFIMVVLGIGVAFLIISIITPIYSLISSIQ